MFTEFFRVIFKQNLNCPVQFFRNTTIINIKMTFQRSTHKITDLIFDSL